MPEKDVFASDLQLNTKYKNLQNPFCPTHLPVKKPTSQMRPERSNYAGIMPGHTAKKAL